LNFPTICEVTPTGTVALVAGESIPITTISMYIASLPVSWSSPKR
jgi:hypothetical protein